MAVLVIVLDIAGRIVIERLAGLGVEAGRPVQLIDILLAGNEGAVGAVERVEEAVPRRVNEKLAVLAIDLGVDDRMLGNLIVIIGIVGGVLIAPFDLAVGRAQRQHAGGPFAVARPIFGIPIGAGIADALIERVALRIIGRGLPNRSAAMLPTALAVLPGLVAGS